LERRRGHRVDEHGEGAGQRLGDVEVGGVLDQRRADEQRPGDHRCEGRAGRPEGWAGEAVTAMSRGPPTTWRHGDLLARSSAPSPVPARAEAAQARPDPSVGTFGRSPGPPTERVEGRDLRWSRSGPPPLLRRALRAHPPWRRQRGGVMGKLTRPVYLLGAGCTKFGNLLETPEIKGLSIYELAAQAARRALEDAKTDPREIDAFIIGNHMPQSLNMGSLYSQFTKWIGMERKAGV